METSKAQDSAYLEHTIKKLGSKYGKVRNIDEKAISKENKLWKQIVAIVLDIFFGILVVFSGLFCFNILNNRAQKTPATVFGYSAMRIVSGSMLPGFKIGDAIMVHSVNPHTLSVGDKIAFYVYNRDVSTYSSCVLTPVGDDGRQASYTYSFKQFLGIQSHEVQEAAVNGATLVFHEIIGIEEDQNGTRWFETKGTNNASADNWHIQEQYVVGIYVDGAFATTVAKLLSSASSSWSFLLILIVPIAILAFMIIRGTFKDVQLAKLELDCIEEKRKITDPVCVKNKIGLNMNKRDKFKILALAPEDQKMEYVKLLWPEEKIPNCVRKYYLKRGALLGPLQKLRDINRKCEVMYKKGTSLEKIGAYYAKERQKIEKELDLRYKRIMKMR